MGLFSSSKKKTINQDNRTVNDYSGADFSQQIDNSQQLDSSVTGDLNNNTGTINLIDGGAFELVSQSNNNMAALSETGMELGYQLGVDGLNAGVELGTNSMELSSNVVAQNNALMETHAALVNQQGSRNLDAALAVHETGLAQLSMGSELALGLAKMNQDSAFYQQENNNDALTNGFKSMMQFADGYSRSDGAMVAETNMKTVGVIAISAVIAIFILKKVK